MNTTAAKKNSAFNTHKEGFKLLIGVGMDGTAIVLSVLYGNKTLIEDIATMGVETALWPSEMPTEQGLYLFSGYSQFETLDREVDDSLKEMFHYATYQKVVIGYENAVATPGLTRAMAVKQQ